MDSYLTEGQRQLQYNARQFANTLKPLARQLEISAEPVNNAWRRRLADMGFLALNVGERYGGLAMSHLDALVVLEAFAKVSSAVAFPLFESVVGAVKLVELGSSEPLKESVIAGVCSGEITLATAFYESEFGYGVLEAKAHCRIFSNKLVLSGSKRWCSGATQASGYLVLCRLSEADTRSQLGVVYVPRDQAGVLVGKPEPLMGLRGIPTAEVSFSEVELPRDYLVVTPDSLYRLQQVMHLESCGNAIMSIAQGAASFEEVLRFLQDQKIPEQSESSLRVAHMAMRIEAARQMVWRALTKPGFPSEYDANLAKCFANEMAREVVSEALQMMGAQGYSAQYTVERRLRDVWGWNLLGGDNDFNKRQIAAHLRANIESR